MAAYRRLPPYRLIRHLSSGPCASPKRIVSSPIKTRSDGSTLIRNETTVWDFLYSRKALFWALLMALSLLLGGWFWASTTYSQRTPSLHLIGERHSGTNWITQHLVDCFGHEVAVQIRFFTHKHWFQQADLPKNAVVVALFRNPFHWTEAMRLKPYHSPLHFDLHWREFVSKPWTMPRYGEDLKFENVTQETAPNVQCRRITKVGPKKFRYLDQRPHQVIPCRADGYFRVDTPNGKGKQGQALYELRNDGSGLPYENVLKLRQAKIRNFVRLANVTTAFHVVRYEDVVRQGTEQLIEQLAQELGIQAKCQSVPARPSWTDRSLSTDYIEYMVEHVDWDAEALVGYTPAILDELNTPRVLS